MDLQLGDVQTTALIPLVVKASETRRKNARITDRRAVEIVDALGIDMVKNEKYHDTVKNTKAHFVSGTDSGQEIADLVHGFRLVEEHSFNEEMRKYSIRGKLFALFFPKMNDRWATFVW